MLKTSILPLMLLVLAAAPLAAAQQAGKLKLTVKAFQEIETVSKGKKQVKTVPVAKVVPGTEVIYIITFENTGAQAANQVVVTNPLPAELTYKPDSAFGSGATPEVSVDGGRNWGQLGALTVPGPDGKPRSAGAADVTHVRWRLGFAVAPGAKGQVTYRATLK